MIKPSLKLSGFDQLERNIDQWAKQIAQEAPMQIAQQYAPRIENHAKENRPWQDRTGNAVQRLKGFAVKTDNGAMIVLTHGVEYGKWLELKNQGRYATVMPTMQHFYGIIKREVGFK